MPLANNFFCKSSSISLLELNKEDRGNRKFILCTNNEIDEDLQKKLLANGILKGSEEWESNGICQSVTYPRLKTVITGERVDKSSYQKSDDEKKTTLFEEKISLNKKDIKDNDLARQMADIEEIKQQNKDNFDKFEVALKGDKIVLLGIKNKSTFTGISANLKYFKTDFVERHSERVPDELAEHCSEMIEIQKGINVEKYNNHNAQFLLLKNDDEADYLYDNFDKYSMLEEIYIIEDTNEDDSVILSNGQIEKFSKLKVVPIPRWYFENEIKGVI